MKPTYLKYQELYEYDGCSAFVADYLNYEPLGVPNEMVCQEGTCDKKIIILTLQPDKMVSPTLVLKEQKGNCFDYAILLASLLIGVGYDAYCVCGYASQDVCLLNVGRNTNPLLSEKEEVRRCKLVKGYHENAWYRVIMFIAWIIIRSNFLLDAFTFGYC